MNMGNANCINDTVELAEAIDDAGDLSSVGTYQAIGMTILDAHLPGDEPLDTARLTVVASQMRAAGYGRSVDDIELCVQVAMNYRDLTPEVASRLSLEAHRTLARVSDLDSKRYVADLIINNMPNPVQLPQGQRESCIQEATERTSVPTGSIPAVKIPRGVLHDTTFQPFISVLDGDLPANGEEVCQWIEGIGALVAYCVPVPEDQVLPGSDPLDPAVYDVGDEEGGVLDLYYGDDQALLIVSAIDDIQKRLAHFRRSMSECWIPRKRRGS